MTVFDEEGVARLRQLFEFQLDTGLHHGAQLVMYHEGELVADFADGVTGPDGLRHQRHPRRLRTRRADHRDG